MRRSRRLGRICPRCGKGDPCPAVKVGDDHIHAGCRTDQERKAKWRRPFDPLKKDNRRNRTTAALWPEEKRVTRHPAGYVSPEDIANAITPGKTPGVGPQPWHEDALDYRHIMGLTVRECARLCGVSFGAMQKFLNPESKRRQKMRQAERAREARHSDQEYAQRSRDYRRRYLQARRRATNCDPLDPDPSFQETA